MSWRKISVAILIAAALWLVMFSPWTKGLANFWLEMTLSAVILSSMVFVFSEDRRNILRVEHPLQQVIAGIVTAFALWGIFFVGDRLSRLMFDFARPQVDSVYAMKTGLPSPVIAALLLLVIGPAEELFWRGFIQRNLAELTGNRLRKNGKIIAFAATTLIYALVHVWSFNFMLVMAALVAGAVWGLIYFLKPKLLPALIISHALWDALVFVILPI